MRPSPLVRTVAASALGLIAALTARAAPIEIAAPRSVAPNATFTTTQNGGSENVLPVQPFRSMRRQSGHRAYTRSESTNVDATNRVPQSRQRNGETKRNAASLSANVRALEGRRCRLPHFGQAADIVN